MRTPNPGFMDRYRYHRDVDQTDRLSAAFLALIGWIYYGAKKP